MLNNKILLYNLALLATLGLLFMMGGAQFGGFGIAALLLALGNLFVGVIVLFTGRTQSGLTFLLAGGALLLVGFSICSATFKLGGL